MRLLAVVVLLIASEIGAHGQGDSGSVAGVLSDPTGAAFAAVEITLTGIDVRGNYVAKTGADGHYDFASVASGSYRVAVRQPGIVPIGSTLTVRGGTRQTLEIHTALQARIVLGLSAASLAAIQKWMSGGPPPSQPLEWECTSEGARCAAPAPVLVSQQVGDIMLSALARLESKPGLVQMSGLINTDGFLAGASVSSATSEELAAAALAEISRLRWEPARWRDAPAVTSATLDVRC